MEGFRWVDKHNGPVQPALLEVEGLLDDVEEVRLLPPALWEKKGGYGDKLRNDP